MELEMSVIFSCSSSVVISSMKDKCSLCWRLRKRMSFWNISMESKSSFYLYEGLKV
ncbi:hypothetical protein HN51_003582 [Arachis hypogaea]